MPSSRESIDEQAAEWMLCLHEGSLSVEQLQQFEHWKQSSPEHAAAALRMQQVVGQMQALRRQREPSKVALDAAFETRGRLGAAGRTLAMLVCLLVPVALLVGSRYGSGWLADVSTAPAQWQTLVLQDQSTLTLNGSSAVNLHFDADKRQVELLHGEILVQVAHDRTRPFVVQTGEGTLQALGTRFVVRREPGRTVLSMLESRVAARSADDKQVLEVAAGSQALVDSTGVSLLGAVDPVAVDQSWQHHQLVVDDQPVIDVLEQIARHRSGYVRFDRQELSGLRMSAVLPLDDPDRALQLIADTLHLQVRHFSPWLVIVSAVPKNGK